MFQLFMLCDTVDNYSLTHIRANFGSYYFTVLHILLFSRFLHIPKISLLPNFPLITFLSIILHGNNIAESDLFMR